MKTDVIDTWELQSFEIEDLEGNLRPWGAGDRIPLTRDVVISDIVLTC